MLASALRGLPRGTLSLAAVRLMLYLGVQAAYFIGIIGTLTYQLQASTAAIAAAVGLFNLLIIIGNAAGGSVLDLYGPRMHTAVTLGVAAVSSILFQLVVCTVTSVLAMSAGFGFATGLGFAYLSAYPAYLSDDAEVLKRVNALLSVVSNTAVMVGPAVGGIIAAVLPSQRVFVFAGALAVAAALPAARLLKRAEHARRRRAAAGNGADGASAAHPDDEAGGTFADSAHTVFAVPSLALLFWVGVLAYAGYGAFDPLESLYYRDVLHVEISWMGWLSSAAGVGSVIGAALAMRVPRRHVNVRTLMVLIALEGAACILYVGTPYVACALAGQLLLGAAFGVITPLQNTLVQIHAPLKLLGRVNSVMNAGFNGAGVVPLLAAPVLAELFGVQGVLVGASCMVLLVPIACMVGMRAKISRIVADEG
ncbi:MFS transporter [Collinsella tanakaei]|uniref:MFS transporter n=1 Tax=Collinsella tanakaei TaxID=626935 RepID=UPI0025A379D2|nr:MFS transporter [Collinsella tanakaei]MDM8299900.1 MFS transporter [Collinsella tanakaei]